LFQAGKCRFKKEMPKEEGRDSRMIPVKYYAQVETREDWNITEIEEHRDERHRLKRPEDFALESFENIQVYVCSYQSSGNTCKSLRQQGAVEKSSTCLERMGNVCVKWQKVYRVPRPGSAKTTIQDVSRGHIEAFNADGRMNDTSYTENREGADAIARLTALRDVGAAMPKLNTGDANALSVFRGEDNRCVSQAGNNRCPNGKGSKEPGDLVLEQKYNEGKCIRVGIYTPPTRNFGTMIGQKRTTTTFCCYESILSYVLHKGAIDQGIKSLGSPQSPDCGALTLAQLQRLQWDRVDFTPFVREVTSKVSLNAAEVGGRSATTVRSHLENQMRSQQHQARERAALR
jgi:conjugal transfer mating pair stabilization protein TraN